MSTGFTSLEHAAIEQIELRFDDTIDFLRLMVQCPSVLGNEKGVQEVVFKRLQHLGLAAEMWDVNLEELQKHPGFGKLDIGYKDRPNVNALWPATGMGGRSVIFNGHIDVVSAEPLANWSHDPFGAEIVGDWMYGRGAADMKGGVAAMILAVEAVRSIGVGLNGDVILESVIEEECTGNGALACALRGLKADAAIVPESHGLQASLATVGVIWFRVRTRGQASHVLKAEAAVNAIEKMYLVIKALRQLESELNSEERHPYYRDLPHPINLNIGVIQSGDWPSTVPSECVMECRLSCLPGVSVHDIQERVRRAISELVDNDDWLREHLPELEFFGFQAEPSVVDPKTSAMRMLAVCHRDIIGQDLVFRPGTATTDQRFFLNNLGMSATSYGPTGENIHGGEERVLIPSIAQSAKVMALYLLRWCGVAEG